MQTIKRTLYRVGAGATLAATSAQTALAQQRPRVDNPVSGTNFSDVLASVINSLLIFAGAIAVLFLIIGGFRYVISTGNPDQVEGAKKTIMYAILGLVIIFIAFVLTQLVMSYLGVTSGFRLLAS